MKTKAEYKKLWRQARLTMRLNGPDEIIWLMSECAFAHWSIVIAVVHGLRQRETTNQYPMTKQQLKTKHNK